jgi:hypothetical protein
MHRDSGKTTNHDVREREIRVSLAVAEQVDDARLPGEAIDDSPPVGAGIDARPPPTSL